MARRILLAEDDEDARALMASALTRGGYQVTQAREMMEAIHQFDESPLPFDLLITDVRLAEATNGFVLAKHFLDKFPTSQIMFVSGDRDCFASPGVQQFGDSPFIAKPFNVSELIEAVDGLMAKSAR